MAETQRRPWGWWREARARLSGEPVWGTPVLFAVCVVAWFSGLMADFIRRPGSWAGWTLAGAVTAALEFLVLIALRRLLQPRPRWWVTVVVVGIVAAMRSFLQETLAWWIDPSVPYFLLRPISAVLVAGWVLVLGSELHERTQHHREIAATLTATREQLLVAVAALETQVIEAKQLVRAEVQKVLDPAFENLRRRLRGAPENRAEMAQLVNRAVDDAVRPLVRSLSDPSNLPHFVLPALQAPVGSRTTLPRHFNLPEAIRPITIAAAAWTFVMPFTIVAPGGRVSWTLHTFTLVWGLLVLLACKAFWPRRHRVVPLAVGAPLFFVIFLLAFGPPVALWPPAVNISNRTYGELRPIAAAVEMVIAVTLGLASLVGQQQQQLEADLAEANHELERLLARNRTELWFARRSLSWVLHGPVQSALVAASLRLSGERNLDEFELAEIERLIDEAGRQVASVQENLVGLALALSQLVALWAGTCEISLDAPADLVARVDGFPPVAAGIGEVVREGVSNAVRHGGADQVRVRLSDESPGILLVEVSDNGSGLAAGATAGIGSEMLDQICFSWQRDQSSGGGVRLLARVAA